MRRHGPGRKGATMDKLKENTYWQSAVKRRNDCGKADPLIRLDRRVAWCSLLDVFQVKLARGTGVNGFWHGTSNGMADFLILAYRSSSYPYLHYLLFRHLLIGIDQCIFTHSGRASNISASRRDASAMGSVFLGTYLLPVSKTQCNCALSWGKDMSGLMKIDCQMECACG